MMKEVIMKEKNFKDSYKIRQTGYSLGRWKEKIRQTDCLNKLLDLLSTPFGKHCFCLMHAVTSAFENG